MNPETAMFEKVTTRSVLYSYQVLMGSAFAAAVHERRPKNLAVQKVGYGVLDVQVTSTSNSVGLQGTTQNN
jgi:hypothetical protein